MRYEMEIGKDGKPVHGYGSWSFATSGGPAKPFRRTLTGTGTDCKKQFESILKGAVTIREWKEIDHVDVSFRPATGILVKKTKEVPA